jgi:hypothetical protein|tara:strand:- start:131 stop:238 length:108 start_codon:yes stop_codon:yes gene_type:complete
MAPMTPMAFNDYNQSGFLQSAGNASPGARQLARKR